MGLLIEYRKRKGHDITVVFDGWKNGGATESSSIRGGIRIIYSRLGERADSVIKRIASSGGRQWIVISSDREIADHAWANGSTPVASEVFLPFVDSSGPDADIDDSGPEKCEYEGEAVRCRKGNPQQLSRKERAIKRALVKL